MIYAEPPYPFFVLAQRNEKNQRYVSCVCCGQKDSIWWHSAESYLARIVPDYELVSFRQPQSERMGDFSLAVIELGRLHAPHDSISTDDWIALHHANSIQTLELNARLENCEWHWLIAPTVAPTIPTIMQVRVRMKKPFVAQLPRTRDFDSHMANRGHDLPHMSCSAPLQLPVGSFLPLRTSTGMHATAAVFRLNSWDTIDEAIGVLYVLDNQVSVRSGTILSQSGFLRDGAAFSEEIAVVLEVSNTETLVAD